MIQALWNKKTFQRIFLNEIVNSLEIHNRVIVDIGGGDKTSSYHMLLSQKQNQFISVDMTKNCDYKIDLENEALPFETNSVEVVFCFNVLEHIFNYQHLLDEIYRILKKDAQLYIYVPFLFHKHAHPNDYFRFSDTALIKLLENRNFDIDDISINYGIGKNIFQNLFWIAHTKKLFFVGNALTIILGVTLHLFDVMLNFFNVTHTINQNYILGVYVKARKGEM